MLQVDVPPYRLSGVVYCALLNHRPQWTCLGAAAHQAPYKAPAEAPVLALKPRNTFAASGARVAVPADGGAMSVGATLAILIGRPACRVSSADALGVVAGYAVVVDLRVPSASHYRPSVRLRARDGSCVFGATVVPASAVPEPDALKVRVQIDGQIAQSRRPAIACAAWRNSLPMSPIS